MHEFSEAMISPERMPMWILHGGGVHTLWSLIDMDYGRICHDVQRSYYHTNIVRNCMDTVRQLYIISAYRGPLNDFRRMRTRYGPQSRFTALLDEIQGGGHDVA